MMAITTKIHANNTKKSVIDKLSLKVGVHDVQWIEFEVRSRTYIRLAIRNRLLRSHLTVCREKVLHRIEDQH